MSALLLSVVAGAAGGGVVAASREAARYLRRYARRLGRRRHFRVTRRPHASSAAARPSDAHAAYRAAQLRAYADHLARGDTRLREQLHRFEKPRDDVQYRPGDQPW